MKSINAINIITYELNIIVIAIVDVDVDVDVIVSNTLSRLLKTWKNSKTTWNENDFNLNKMERKPMKKQNKIK